MEKFGPQLYESDEESDKDKKAGKEKKTKDGSTKAAKSLSSVLRLRSENEEVSKTSHQAEVEMKLAFMAGKFTELPGAKSEKPRKQAAAGEVSKQDDERSAPAEAAVQAQDERGPEAVRLETGEPAQAKIAEAEGLPKTTAEAGAAEEAASGKPEAPESLPKRELGSNELGGEFYLASDKPIKEQVILLRDAPANETIAEVHDAADGPEEEPELHQMGGEEPAAEPEPPISAGGEVPPVKPPENTAEASGEPEEPEEPEEPANEPAPSFEWLSSLGHPEQAADADPRPEPAQVYRAYMQQQAAQQAVVHQSAPQTGFPLAEPKPVTQEELDDRVRSASRYYQRRGLLTGLLLGGWYEHRKHKRREKKAEKLAKTKDKQLEAARKDYTFGLQEQERQRAELNARLNVAEGRVTIAEQHTADQLKAQEAMARAAAKPEQPAGAEQLAIPPEHRVELSTWLSTEIDRRTGRAVERPTFQYGHEYYRERAQEGMPISQRNAAAGAAALMAANGQTPADGSSLPPADLPSATMQGRPSQAGPQQADGTQRKSEPIASAALLWPWVLALVIIVVLLAVALR